MDSKSKSEEETHASGKPPPKDRARERVVPLSLARTLANPLRARILGELCLRPMSPSQFVENFGGDLSTISRHFRHLSDWGYIEVVEELRGGRRRGSVERVYRATQRDHLDSEASAMLSLDEREERSRNAVAFFYRRITEAIEAGTFDAEVDRHFSFDVITLDRQAWKEVTDRLDQVLAWLPELQAESAQRIAGSKAESIRATVGLSAFPSPTESDLKGLRRGRAKSDQ